MRLIPTYKRTFMRKTLNKLCEIKRGFIGISVLSEIECFIFFE